MLMLLTFLLAVILAIVFCFYWYMAVILLFRDSHNLVKNQLITGITASLFFVLCFVIWSLWDPLARNMLDALILFSVFLGFLFTPRLSFYSLIDVIKRHYQNSHK